MKPSEAYDLYGPQEFERWFARRMRRQLIMSRCFIVLIALFTASISLYWVTHAFIEAYGSDAWAAGAFLASLLIYGAYMAYRYLMQRYERDEYEN